MGKSFLQADPIAADLFAQANDVLGYDLKKIILEGPEETLVQTQNTQPAIWIVSAIAYRLLSKELSGSSLRPALVAGHSLGEYSALYASGAVDFQSALKLVKYRGQFLNDCCQENPGRMAAIVGLDRTELKEMCDSTTNALDFSAMVNFNSPGQIVVAGTQNGVDQLLALAQKKPGVRAIALNVAGAFHSKLMSQAAIKMEEVLKSMPFQRAQTPIVANCDARPTSEPDAIKEKLVRQIDHPVFWEDSIQRMIQEGVELFIEVGPGRVLSGLVRRIDKTKKIVSFDDMETLHKVINELNLTLY